MEILYQQLKNKQYKPKPYRMDSTENGAGERVNELGARSIKLSTLNGRENRLGGKRKNRSQRPGA